ncbi:MAG TPA: type II toxin-antitoxin system HicA family toxin [Ktedonobacterales bacterium]
MRARFSRSKIGRESEGSENQQQKAADVKVREAIKAVAADGWYLVTIKGDHRQYRHPTKSGRVTIPGHPNDTLAPKTRDSIFQQAGLPKPRKRGIHEVFDHHRTGRWQFERLCS